MNDRELDALVAEKVFGWTYYEDKRHHWIVLDADNEHMSEPFVRVRGHDVDTGKPWTSPWWSACDYKLPYCSTDIAAAWLVVEKMRLRGYRVVVESNVFDWTVTLFHDNSITSLFDHDVCRAICLASLKALGVEIPA